jgi:hypothetical protein
MIRSIAPALLLLAACSQSTDTAKEEPPPPAPKPKPAPVGLEWKAPTEWKQEEPASKMRKAQYRVPDRDKTEADAIFVYSGVMGGGVDGNIARWKGQFPGSGESKTQEFQTGDMTVHLLDIAGDFEGDMGTEPIKDAQMLAAIVRTPQGDHFLKLLGPRGTVGDWRDAFVELLKGLKNRGA